MTYLVVQCPHCTFINLVQDKKSFTCISCEKNSSLKLIKGHRKVKVLYSCELMEEARKRVIYYRTMKNKEYGDGFFRFKKSKGDGYEKED